MGLKRSVPVIVDVFQGCPSVIDASVRSRYLKTTTELKREPDWNSPEGRLGGLDSGCPTDHSHRRSKSLPSGTHPLSSLSYVRLCPLLNPFSSTFLHLHCPTPPPHLLSHLVPSFLPLHCTRSAHPRRSDPDTRRCVISFSQPSVSRRSPTTPKDALHAKTSGR